LMLVIVSPRVSMMAPIEAAAKPLPNDESTPPVMKMYFVFLWASMFKGLAHGAR